MSRYKPYGKSKGHGGGGFQFDKLLKVCSNSKKASAGSATKTVGNLGRFGSTNFTSTRNSNLDSSGEDDAMSLYKRPRLDAGMPPSYALPPPSYPSYGYQEVQNQNIPAPGMYMPHYSAYNNVGVQQYNTNANTEGAAKPKKFFKSRNPLGVADPPPTPLVIATNARPSPPEPRNYVPPITIPVPKLTNRSTANTNKPGRKRQVKEKEDVEPKPKGTKRQARSDKVLQSVATDEEVHMSPPSGRSSASTRSNHARNNVDTNSGSVPLTSPSIKLRIFKDKTTSKFVSVSDASPPKLQAQKSPAKKSKEAKKPGRPKKDTSAAPTAKAKKVISLPPPPPPPSSGRVTRNSRRQREASADTPMPTLRRVSEDASTNNIQDADGARTGRRDSGQELVKKLEEEDDEFRQMSAMLSSMEGDEEDSNKATHAQEPLQRESSTYSGSPERRPSSHSPGTPRSREFRSILEDDWNDDEDSPKKGSQTPKESNFTRFDMAAIIPEPPAAPFPRSKAVLRASPVPEAEVEPEKPPMNKVFNAPYAVRNLLADFTDKNSGDSPSPNEQEATIQTHIEEITTRSRLARQGTNSINLTIKQSTGANTKKVSIFKSRAASAIVAPEGETASPKKRLALYRHKFGQESGEAPDSAKKTEPVAQTYTTFNEDAEYDQRGIRIKNVKAIHELQERGEVEEFDGDILYILEDLKDKNPISSRCLSAITLAMRCMEPAFRMHLRAQGTVGHFCRELHDAPNNPVLALLSATVLFVLSQDRLNMDLDTDSLQLLISLTKLEEQTHLIDESPEISKHRQRVIDLVNEMKQRGRAKDLKIERISASEIALETLLHLTSKRAGDWVKRELRILGGLDYIVAEVDKLFTTLKSDFSTIGWAEIESVKERLSKVDRCIRVLHQVSFDHEENQRFLLGALEYSEGDEETAQRRKTSPAVFVKLLQVLTEQISVLSRNSEQAQMLRDIAMSVLKLLVNLSQDHRGIVLGSEILSSHDGVIDLVLYSVFNLSASFPDEKVFELLINSLQLLLNLVEHSRTNRNKILNSTIDYSSASNGTLTAISSIDAFVQMFLSKELQAKTEELHTDNILTTSTDGRESKDSQGSSDSQKNLQDDGSSSQGIIDKLVETAGKHMENSLLAAYISLLLAYIIMDDTASTEHVRNSLPNSKFLPLMVFLKKLFNFMSITSAASGSIRGLKATSLALNFYGQHDPASNEELKKIIPD